MSDTAKPYYNLNVRLSADEREFLDDMGINKSKLVHDAIRHLKENIPSKLEEKKQMLETEVEETKKKIHVVRRQQEQDKAYMDIIKDDFQKWDREKYNARQNLAWIRRYRDDLKSHGILVSDIQLLEYCQVHPGNGDLIL
jgi:hypothetical protein